MHRVIVSYVLPLSYGERKTVREVSVLVYHAKRKYNYL